MSDTPITDKALEDYDGDPNVGRAVDTLLHVIEQLELDNIRLRESLAAVKEWVQYSLDRARTCDDEADGTDATLESYTYRRLRTKAGMFRSLALEVGRKLPHPDAPKQ